MRRAARLNEHPVPREKAGGEDLGGGIVRHAVDGDHGLSDTVVDDYRTDTEPQGAGKMRRGCDGEQGCSRNLNGGAEMRRTLVVLGLVAVATGCAGARSSVPSFPQAPGAYSFEGLKPSGVRVQVLDQRAESAGDGTAEELGRGVTDVLVRSGVSVSEQGPVLLQIRVTQHRSDFSLGNWNACTGLVATVRGVRPDPVQIPVERCVTRANTFGYRSASDASQASFSDAVSALLTELDLL